MMQYPDMMSGASSRSVCGMSIVISGRGLLVSLAFFCACVSACGCTGGPLCAALRQALLATHTVLRGRPSTVHASPFRVLVTATAGRLFAGRALGDGIKPAHFSVFGATGLPWQCEILALPTGAGAAGR